jgi:hypothetical protein
MCSAGDSPATSPMRYISLVLLTIASIALFPLVGSAKVGAAAIPADKPKHAKTEPPTVSPTVKVTGSLSTPVVTTFGRVSGFVTVANESTESISATRIIVHVPEGFSSQGARIEQDQPTDLHCSPIGQNTRSTLKCEVPGTLEQGAERAITFEWRAESDQPQQSVDVTVEWVSGNLGFPSSRSISLGEISAEASWKLWVIQNPLVLPLISGVLGGLIVAFVQAWLASRERRLEDHRAALAKLGEEDRAAKSRRLDEERAHKTATWDMMLPQAHQLAMRHYVHMQSFVRGAISYLARYEKASKPDGRPDPELNDLPIRAFLCLILFARRMQYSTDTVGGLYFKNRVAEEIVSRCYYAYRKLYFDRNIQARGAYEWILSRILPTARTSDLYEKMRASSSVGANQPASSDPKVFEELQLGKALQAAFQEFDTLLMQPAGDGLRAKVVSILEGFAAVMQFEMNRPYRYWYNQPSLLDITPNAKTAIETLCENEPFGMGENWTNFRKTARDYLQDACTKGTEDSLS